MRVATFNIRHGLDRSGTHVDLDGLAHASASLGADIVGLQEVDVGVRRSGRADLGRVAAGGRAVAFGRAIRLSHGLNGRYGNALVAPWLRDVETVRLHRPRGDEQRAVLLARAGDGDGGEASVAVTHLSVIAMAAAEQLDDVVNRLVRRPPPWVLMADANLHPDVVAPAVERHGLVLADTSEPSYPAGAPVARIDHIAAGGGLVPGPVTVVPTSVSDHRAVVAELRSA